MKLKVTHHDGIDLEVHVVFDLGRELADQQQSILAHHVHIVLVVFLYTNNTLTIKYITSVDYIYNGVENNWLVRMVAALSSVP